MYATTTSSNIIAPRTIKPKDRVKYLTKYHLPELTESMIPNSEIENDRLSDKSTDSIVTTKLEQLLEKVSKLETVIDDIAKTVKELQVVILELRADNTTSLL